MNYQLGTMKLKNYLLSEAIGDIAGSVYEFHPQKDITKVDLFNKDATYTDDTVCTFAVAEALIHYEDVASVLVKRCLNDVNRGYGGGFLKWLSMPDRHPYNSFGNGAAMRCSAAGFMARDEDECIRLARMSAECTHNHPEGIKGAVATALTIFYLMQGKDKAYIRKYVLDKYYPDFTDLSIDDIYPHYSFNMTCQGTVPVSLIAFLSSGNYADCIKQNIAMGGDSDTMAAIAGPMAYAYYREMPQNLVDVAKEKLPEWMLEINDEMDELVTARGCLKDSGNKCRGIENQS